MNIERIDHSTIIFLLGLLQLLSLLYYALMLSKKQVLGAFKKINADNTREGYNIFSQVTGSTKLYQILKPKLTYF